MLKKPNVPVIAIEEHYSDPELLALFTGRDAFAPPHVLKALDDTGEARLKDMDACGIDVQVLSHTAPSLQKVSDGAVELARRVNDRLAADRRSASRRAMRASPRCRPSDPAAAADELARCVEKLGFKGAMIHGLAHGQFIDDQRYWPIFARAEALDVPIYLHPSMPHEAVIDAYYKEYAKDFPVLLRAAWGFTVETATLGVRLVLSGLFEKHRTKFILGHLGEGLPFLLWRINNGLARPGQKPVAVPRHLQRAFLRDDERLLLRSGVAAVRAGTRHRPHPVRGRLSVRGERAGAGVARARAAVRRGQGQDRERQRQAAVEDVSAASIR